MRTTCYIIPHESTERLAYSLSPYCLSSLISIAGLSNYGIEVDQYQRGASGRQISFYNNGRSLSIPCHSSPISYARYDLEQRQSARPVGRQASQGPPKPHQPSNDSISIVTESAGSHKPCDWFMQVNNPFFAAHEIVRKAPFLCTETYLALGQLFPRRRHLNVFIFKCEIAQLHDDCDHLAGLDEHAFGRNTPRPGQAVARLRGWETVAASEPPPLAHSSDGTRIAAGFWNRICIWSLLPERLITDAGVAIGSAGTSEDQDHLHNTETLVQHSSTQRWQIQNMVIWLLFHR